MNQSPFKYFTIHATHPHLKIMHSVLLVMKGSYNVLLLHYSFALVVYDYNWRRISSFSTRTTHPFLKLKVLCLVSYEGWVKRLLLLYKWLIQP